MSVFTAQVFKDRRNQIISKLKDDEALVLSSHPQYYRQTDVPYLYRQDSCFYYLTGFEEPQSYLILKRNPPSHILFVQDKDPKKEMWDGFRFGPNKAKTQFLMDECIGIQHFDDQILSFLKGISRIYQIRKTHSLFDQKLDQIIAQEKTHFLRSSKKYRFLDASDRLAEMRMIKSSLEVDAIRKACEITRQGHINVMKATRPGVNERQLHGVFIESIMSQMSQRESYTGIFASGENALILHYIDNNQECLDGDLVLVDAGAEWNYYASDITRTFPVNGKFSVAQKTLYNHVLSVQKQVIQMIQPGVSFRKIQNETTRLMFEFLKKENILNANHQPSDVKLFFPHNFGHLLGIDVHDVGVCKNGEKTYRLESGMVLTVEPGIYFPKNCSQIPKPFRGIGIRIEDNILVTDNGHENLSQSIPKEVDEIEQIMSAKR